MTDEQIIEHPCPRCGVTLNGWSGLRHYGHYAAHAHADCINNLRHRAEKAEALAAKRGRMLADLANTDVFEVARVTAKDLAGKDAP